MTAKIKGNCEHCKVHPAIAAYESPELRWVKVCADCWRVQWLALKVEAHKAIARHLC